ncbi:MAG: NADPH:quinone oxidoreductase family protein [Woeseiaceae bacterium]
MRALVCKAFGHTDDLVIEDRDDPVAGDGEILVDVKAAGINFPDILNVAGLYQEKAPLPFVPGNEAAGLVADIGPGVERFKKGDRVIVMPRGGAFASRCTASQYAAAPMPPGTDYEQAAGFAVTTGTSYHALRQCANLQAGETVLVLGAAGGVGIAAVEIASALGARVIAAASTDEKYAFARAAGAADTINYSSQDLRERVKTLTSGNGVDVVYDPVGGEQALQAFRGLAWHGRYLVVGFTCGEIPRFPANIALLKEASVVGVWWGTWLQKHPQQHAQNLQEINDLLEAGKLAPKVTKVFQLDDYGEAFRTVSERRAIGKIVLAIA